jgi:hypothetical protein
VHIQPELSLPLQTHLAQLADVGGIGLLGLAWLKPVSSKALKIPDEVIFGLASGSPFLHCACVP